MPRHPHPQFILSLSKDPLKLSEAPVYIHRVLNGGIKASSRSHFRADRGYRKEAK